MMANKFRRLVWWAFLLFVLLPIIGSACYFLALILLDKWSGA